MNGRCVFMSCVVGENGATIKKIQGAPDLWRRAANDGVFDAQSEGLGNEEDQACETAEEGFHQLVRAGYVDRLDRIVVALVLHDFEPGADENLADGIFRVVLQMMVGVQALEGGNQAELFQHAGDAENQTVRVEGVDHEDASVVQQRPHAGEERPVVFQVRDQREHGDGVVFSLELGVEHVALDERDVAEIVRRKVETRQLPVWMFGVQPFQEIAAAAPHVEQRDGLWPTGFLDGRRRPREQGNIRMVEPVLVRILVVLGPEFFPRFHGQFGERMTASVAAVEMHFRIENAGLGIADSTFHGIPSFRLGQIHFSGAGPDAAQRHTNMYAISRGWVNPARAESSGRRSCIHAFHGI